MDLRRGAKKLTNATICDAGRGPYNDPTLGEFLPIQEMVSPPQSQIAKEFRGAADQAHAPSRTPNPETVAGAGL